MASSKTDQARLGEIMRKLHYEGMKSDKVLAEAWRRLRKEKGVPEMTVQQRRYAVRKSFQNPRRKVILNKSAYSVATKHGYPYIGPGFEERDGIIFNRFSKTSNRKPPHILVGFLKSGQAKIIEENPRSKKNPVAIYNPPRGKPLPMSVIEIRYKRSGGKYNGELFTHKFKQRPKVIGLPDGSILIKGNQRLWGTA